MEMEINIEDIYMLRFYHAEEDTMKILFFYGQKPAFEMAMDERCINAEVFHVRLWDGCFMPDEERCIYSDNPLDAVLDNGTDSKVIPFRKAK